MFQAYAYWYHHSLSLGPRVILQPALMQQGYVLYEHIADEHTPLMYHLLTILVPLIPDGLKLAKTALIALVSLLTLITFLLGQKTAGQLGGFTAALFFTLWSPVFGFGKLWHETLLALFYLILILYAPIDSRHKSKTMLLMGFLGGLGILAKQHAIVVIAGMVLWYTILERHLQNPWHQILIHVTQFMLGIVSLPLIYGMFHLLQGGTLGNLLYWTIEFNMVNSYIQLGAQAPRVDQITLLYPAYLLLPLTLIPLIDLKKSGNKEWQRISLGLLLLLTSSFTAYPRFALFHLQPSLPILAYLSATSLVYILRYRNDIFRCNVRILIQAAFMILILWIGTIRVQAFLSVLVSNIPPKIWEYSDLISLAKTIRQQISSDCFYIFPDDEATANLYYLTGCLPPKFWVLTYPWFMQSSIKEKILETFKEHPPEWVIYAPGRWSIESYAPEIINHIQANYEFFTRLSWEQGEIQLLRYKPRNTYDCY